MVVTALHVVKQGICSVCTRRKLKVNVGKSKMMVFERREVEVVDFNTPYRMSVPKVRGGSRRENGGSERA